jgi:hypothetical protein
VAARPTPVVPSEPSRHAHEIGTASVTLFATTCRPGVHGSIVPTGVISLEGKTHALGFCGVSQIRMPGSDAAECTSDLAHKSVGAVAHSSHFQNTGSAYRAPVAPALQWSSWCSRCSAQRGYHGVRPHRDQGRRTAASPAFPRRRPRNDDSARLHALDRRCAWTRHGPDEPAAEAPVVAEPRRQQREHRIRCATAWAHAGRFIVGRGLVVAGVHARLRFVESAHMADVRRHDRPLEPACR